MEAPASDAEPTPTLTPEPPNPQEVEPQQAETPINGAELKEPAPQEPPSKVESQPKARLLKIKI